ncbi:MAG: decarboxylating 6-phosphogluconate dehydrogenase [Dehalococcoidia bacterium]|nr:decarboxylating 6-phosphogluconate dehydrogenase [Dehalococcoidia bacterium]
MSDEQLEFGIIGLGKMGDGVALQALRKGMRVLGSDIKRMPQELLDAGIVVVSDYRQFREKLSRARIIFLYVPAGKIVDTVIDELVPYLDQGDIIIDGGNSYWGDSIHRHQRLREIGIHLIDLGTSGGIKGAYHGACFMAGGDRHAVRQVEGILLNLAVQGGYVYAGASGAGHFTKLVHNGIEFGMLQAIAEGVELLENYKDKLDVAEVLRCWRHGSVIRSWLIDLMEEAYRTEGGLDKVPAYVEDTGEVNWLIADALRMEIPIPAISLAVMQLLISRDKKEYWARAIAMMRQKFGGHTYGASEPISRERREGQVSGTYHG